MFYGRVYLSKKYYAEILSECYNIPVYRHQGLEKILERISQYYYFPRMRKVVEEKIQKYNSCRRNKPD